MIQYCKFFISIIFNDCVILHQVDEAKVVQLFSWFWIFRLFLIINDSVLSDYLLRIDFEMWNYSTFIRLLLSNTKLLSKGIVSVCALVANIPKVSIYLYSQQYQALFLKTFGNWGNLEQDNLSLFEFTFFYQKIVVIQWEFWGQEVGTPTS